MLTGKGTATRSEGWPSRESKAARERRRALGIYYTPPEAAKVLARWAIRHRDETLLEPSFGGCAMLSAAVSVFKSLGNPSPSRQLFGYDIDSEAFEHLARMGIDNATVHFKRQDFLLSRAKGLQVDAVLANPPFVSYHRLNERQRRLADEIRNRYLPGLPKRASLWAYFLLHATSFLRPGGRMAFVLPNAVGTADYARPLLTFLQNRFSRVEILHVAERLFIQAGADERISLLLLNDYVPDGRPNPSPVLYRDVELIDDIAISEDSRTEIDVSNDLCCVQRVAASTLSSLSEGVFVSLGSVASVRIGEVVGDIPNFVRPLAAWLQRKVDPKHLVPLLTRSAQVPGISTVDAHDTQMPCSIPYLLLPPERRIPKSIESYLTQYSEADIAGNRTFLKRQIWYRCSYETNADAFIGSMSHGYPRIIGNDSAISCSNAFYKIIVHDHPKFAAWLPILSVTTPLRLSAEILGRTRGSGGIKLEPSDVRKLCVPKMLPDLSETEFQALREKISSLVKSGELDAASQLADSTVFLKPGLLDPNTMSALRTMRLGLTNRRLPKSRVAN